MNGEPSGNEPPKRRPSGAPEIPEVLRQRPREPERERGKTMTPLVRGLALGWDLVGSVAAGLVIGVLLDRWLGTSPAFVLVGLAVGLSGSTWRLLQQSSRDARAERARRGGERGGRGQNH
ncbi:MAG: AtpZ/AtpI family protein [Planctomycetota bacterium]